jgi:[acyl-carrier-protein] S-malonyltransferase
MDRIAKLGFIFPGQGSQYLGMGKLLNEKYSEANHVFSEADDVLGYSLSTICFEGPEDILKLTANTQPAILAVSVAAFRVLNKLVEVKADFLSGHSLGEYSALVADGCITFRDAVKLVHLRGKFMQEAVPVGEGAMAAVLGLQDHEVEEICVKVSLSRGHVSPANFNSPGQVVISGNVGAVNLAMELLKDKGAKKIVSLPVSAPFHSALMEPAAAKLREVLESIAINEPNGMVVSNVTGEPYRNSADVKNLMVQQVMKPVRWTDCVRYMIQHGVNEFIEIGPGKVLSGLTKRIDKNAKTVNIESPDELELFAKLYK